MSTHSAAALPAANAPVSISVSRRRIGRVLTALPVLFLLFDTALKIGNTAPALAAMPQLGYPLELTLPIGLIELFCLILYVVPRTSVIGAILFTGYLCGAIATHLRVGNPLFSHILFPIYIAALLWGGLYLRDARVRALLRSSNN